MPTSLMVDSPSRSLNFKAARLIINDDTLEILGTNWLSQDQGGASIRYVPRYVTLLLSDGSPTRLS